jgi:hypothetical protein
MNQYYKQTKGLLVIGFIFVLLGQTSQASLIGTELSVQIAFALDTSEPVEITEFLDTPAVVGPGVEFPDLVTTTGVDTNIAINAGEDFLEMEIENRGIAFGVGDILEFRFTFDSNPPVEITSATIDTSVTTLGLGENFAGPLSQSNLMFSGNQLTIGVAGLSFNTAEESTFLRIDIASVPVPTALWLFGTGILGLLRVKHCRAV